MKKTLKAIVKFVPLKKVLMEQKLYLAIYFITCGEQTTYFANLIIFFKGFFQFYIQICISRNIFFSYLEKIIFRVLYS